MGTVAENAWMSREKHAGIPYHAEETELKQSNMRAFELIQDRNIIYTRLLFFCRIPLHL